jgi:hypothetical protein
MESTCPVQKFRGALDRRWTSPYSDMETNPDDPACMMMLLCEKDLAAMLALLLKFWRRCRRWYEERRGSFSSHGDEIPTARLWLSFLQYGANIIQRDDVRILEGLVTRAVASRTYDPSIFSMLRDYGCTDR